MKTERQKDKEELAQPWRRLEEETPKAFDAFTVYLELGPSRSIGKVRETIGKRSGYDRQLEKWSSKYNWIARAKAFDTAELEAKIDDRIKARELARQVYVDNVFELATIQIETIKGKRKLSTTQQRLLTDALDRAGVLAPKRVEVTGAEGADLFGVAGHADPLDQFADEELDLLIELASTTEEREG